MSVGIVFLFISCAATSAAPYLFGKVIDYAIPKTNWLVAHEGLSKTPKNLFEISNL